MNRLINFIFNCKKTKQMQRIPFGSPVKENVFQTSPTKKGKMGPLAELITFIKTSGVNMPPNIAKIVGLTSNPESPLKKVASNREHVDDPKKLKVQLTDLQFEFKKMQEDFAQYKRTVKIEKEKEGKKNEQIITRLKSSLECTTEDGAYTLARTKQSYQGEIAQLKERFKLELEQEKTKMIQDYQNKLEIKEKLHQRNVSELQKTFDKSYHQKVKALEDQISANNAAFSQEKKDIALKHKQVIEEKERRHESIRIAIQSEKKTQEKMHEKTKFDAIKEKQKLVSDLCFERNVKVHLEEQLEQKEKEIRKLKNTIKDKEDQLILLEQKHQKKLKKNEEEYQSKSTRLVQTQEAELIELKQSQREELEKITEKITELSQLQKERDEIMFSNIEELSLSFDRRPSKKEDLAELEKMKWALTRRQEQIRKLTKDIKYCNMELENKEDLYTRIFRGNSMSRDKKQKEKEEKEQHLVQEKIGKEIISRKSQTSDIKFLLKHYKNP